MATRVTWLPAEDKPEILEEFAAQQRAVHHFIAHHKELREQYPDQWIAVWVDEAAIPTVVGDSVDSIARKARRHQAFIHPLHGPGLGTTLIHGHFGAKAVLLWRDRSWIVSRRSPSSFRPRTRRAERGTLGGRATPEHTDSVSFLRYGRSAAGSRAKVAALMDSKLSYAPRAASRIREPNSPTQHAAANADGNPRHAAGRRSRRNPGKLQESLDAF